MNNTPRIVWWSRVPLVCTALVLYFSLTHATEPILRIIEHQAASFVIVKAENAQIYAGPSGLVRDPESNKVYVARKVGVAQQGRQGGGVVIDSFGIVVTNAHTIEGAGRVKVEFFDGQKAEAEVVFFVPEQDIAFLKVPLEREIIPVVLADEQAMELGMQVFTVGTSDLLKGTVTEGSVVGIGTKTHTDSSVSMEMIKVNFNVYRGDSGGALLDKEGRLVGMIVASSSSGEKVSLAIPAARIKEYLLEYREKRLQ